ncbi:hypothetical protein [Desulfosporosinus sp. FKA]|uniref:hypothetical protein n=1 Tax=Desulfosporosinus sp. FKA TaxID=1969834 RepID=UPI000B49EF8A|nr:hypothetical protein [Desulfosporosinus sp. FKA]
MLNLQTEVERVLHRACDYNSFMNDEQFFKVYQYPTISLVVTKRNNDVTVTFGDERFEFQRLPYNSAWYPIQVVKGNEVTSIVINYENGRAYSARNWLAFWDLAEEVAKKITDTDPEILVLEQKQIAKGIAFGQMSLWS